MYFFLMKAPDEKNPRWRYWSRTYKGWASSRLMPKDGYRSEARLLLAINALKHVPDLSNTQIMPWADAEALVPRR